MAKSTENTVNLEKYDGKGFAPIPIIEAFLNKKYEFIRNPILDRVEYRTKKSKEYKLLTEWDLNSLFRELNNNKIKCSVQILKSLINSDFVTTKDPFLEYYKSLPKWKPKDEDFIEKLRLTIDARNDQFWKFAFKKWIVGVVACSINPKMVNQQVLVFIGKQGLGKSTWLNALVPESLDGYLYTGLVNPSNKDTLVNLSENLLINLDELENLNKTELGSLKSLISQSAIRLRKAYGIHNENFVRRASFVGSVNEVEFLTDTTGNRRYLCVDCLAIDYTHKVNMDNVFAQAYYLYTTGFKHWFDGTDIPVIDQNNNQFIRIYAEEELLLKYFRVPKGVEEGTMQLTPTDILKYMEAKSGMKLYDNSALRKLGSAMSKHGFEKVSKLGSKPYKVIFLETEAKPLTREQKQVFKLRDKIAQVAQKKKD